MSHVKFELGPKFGGSMHLWPCVFRFAAYDVVVSKSDVWGILLRTFFILSVIDEAIFAFGVIGRQGPYTRRKPWWMCRSALWRGA